MNPAVLMLGGTEALDPTALALASAAEITTRELALKTAQDEKKKLKAQEAKARRELAKATAAAGLAPPPAPNPKAKAKTKPKPKKKGKAPSVVAKDKPKVKAKAKDKVKAKPAGADVLEKLVVPLAAVSPTPVADTEKDSSSGGDDCDDSLMSDMRDPENFAKFVSLLPEDARPPADFDCRETGSYVVTLSFPGGESGQLGIWFDRFTFYVYDAKCTPFGGNSINNKGGPTVSFKKRGVAAASNDAIAAMQEGTDQD